MDILNKIFQYLWSLLPDKCQGSNCCKLGIRGNENIVDGKILCDYCHSESKIK